MTLIEIPWPDFDGNGLVDLVDLADFLEEWLATDCTEINTWCQQSDLNQDGRVDIKDYAYFSISWLEQRNL